MNIKRLQFQTNDNDLRDIIFANEYPTLKDLMKEQGISTELADYWDSECDDNPSNPNCLVYDV